MPAGVDERAATGLVVLVEVDTQTAQAVRTGLPAEVWVEELSDSAAIEDRLPSAVAMWDVLVLGARVHEPLRMAQRVHTANPDVALLILAEPSRLSQLRQSVMFTPLLGQEVECEAAGDPGQVALRAREAFDRLRQRRHYRRTLEQLNPRLSRAAPVGLGAEQYLERLLHFAPIGVLTVDPDGRIVALNARATELLGTGMPATADLRLEERFSAEDRPRFARLLASSLSRGAEAGPEQIVVPVDGSPSRVLELTSAPLPARSESNLALVIIQDVTARVEAERERQRAAQAQRLLAEAGEVLAGSLDYGATLEQVVRLVVPRLADCCLLHALDESGHLIWQKVACSDPALETLTRELQAQYASQKSDPPPEVCQVQQNGKPLLVPEPALLTPVEAHPLFHLLQATSLMVLPLETQGRTFGTLTFIATGSTRAYGEDDLSLARDLARRAAMALDNARLVRDLALSLRTRDEFLASASHDLKTPLATIKGQAQLLQKLAARSAGPDATHLAQWARRIDLATSRMRKMVDQFLDIARSQLGQPLALELAPTDLVRLAREVATEYEAESSRHTIVVETDRPHLEGLWDAPRLERAVGNLLDNAIKYSPDGGVVQVTVSQAGPDWAVLSVQDQGMGIPDEDLPRIFERFSRARNVIGRVSGTGVGLASVKQIVQEHDGSVQISSQEGVGTTVTLRLPLRR